MNDSGTKEFRSLEEIRMRKYDLRRRIDDDGKVIGQMWDSLFVRKDDSTRGQFISSIISHSAMAIDIFLAVRKLKKNYGDIFQKKSKR
jgi:hypothetical protein